MSNQNLQAVYDTVIKDFPEYKDSFGADVEDLLLGDIMVDGVGISVNNDRKNWIKNLCNTELGFKFYATAARVLNETE